MAQLVTQASLRGLKPQDGIGVGASRLNNGILLSNPNRGHPTTKPIDIFSVFLLSSQFTATDYTMAGSKHSPVIHMVYKRHASLRATATRALPKPFSF